MQDNLKDKTARGLLWGLVNNGTTQVLNLIIGIFLARMLTQEDYGLVGVLTIFTAIAGNLQSCGFTQAITNMQQPTARDYNSVFWFNVLTGSACYIVLFFCAPLIAAYFRRPELVDLSRFVFIAFLISSFGIAQGAYLFKNLKVRENAMIGITALVVSGTVGITLALCDYSYWSLAWQQVIYIVVVNIGRSICCPWRPSLQIDFRPVKGMLRFSMNILLTKMLNTLSQNILTVIFGRLFPMSVVGNFTQANKWNTMAFSTVSGTIDQVAQPVMAQVGTDADRGQRVFRKMLRFTAFLSFPAMFGLAMVAEEFILITIGDKWLSCVPLMQMLCVSGAFMPIYNMYQGMTISRGRSDIYFWCDCALIALQIAVVLVFASRGITVMVGAYAALNILFLLVWQLATQRLTGISLLHILADVCPFMLASAAVMVVVYWLTMPIVSIYLLLPCRVLLAAALYFLVMKIAGTEILKECLKYVRK